MVALINHLLTYLLTDKKKITYWYVSYWRRH